MTWNRVLSVAHNFGGPVKFLAMYNIVVTIYLQSPLLLAEALTLSIVEFAFLRTLNLCLGSSNSQIHVFQ
jgi:hypothetical protein